MFSKDLNFSDWLMDVRRDLHMHPELSMQEIRTTQKIISILKALDIPARTLPESPGAVGFIQGGKPGPTIALRADIDALPIQELNEISYKSLNKNIMHACGHDANTAIMLGVARAVATNKIASSLKGNIKFLFQPAEERYDGAKNMIRQGVLENPRVEIVIASHVTPDIDTGQVGIFENYGYAGSDSFSLAIKGKGGHAGRPHQTVDSIVAGAYFVNAVQSIVARNINPTEPVVISIGKFHSGDVGNVIPESATIEGSIRTLSSETRDLVFQRLEQTIKGMETMFNVKCRLVFEDHTPCCNNDKDVSQLLHDAALQQLGQENICLIGPTMGSEDFAYFTLERPSAIIRIGARNKEKKIMAPLHSPFFDIDEKALLTGVSIIYQTILDYLT